MLLTVEKVLILKTVEIFSDIPDEYLVELANIIDEIELKAGTVVFEKGDIGSSMYIIIEGKIKIHEDETELAVLGDRQVFGELAALDPEPRLAACTAVENCRLFRVDRLTLFELITEHAKVAEAVIHHLCERVRQNVNT